jgi:nicotinate-nucleotide--dimethylbenzimidazole phosphoribosyltransferase
VPATAAGQVFTDFLGAANRAVADACDAVVLVVAGQPAWLKRAGQVSPEVVTPAAAATAPVPESAVSDALTAPTMTLPLVATGLVIQPGMDLPLPDEGAPAAAQDRMSTLDVAGAGFGNLAEAVSFAAGVQSRPVPAPWTAVRVLLLHGDHEGGAAAGASAGDSARRADQARAGEGPLAALAAAAGASLQVVDAATAAPIEDGPALTPEAAEAALRYGWRLAEEAVDSGIDLLVLGSCGTGAEAAAAAIVAADTGAEAAALLGRVITPGGGIDDNAWMIRCGAVRDALQRIRQSSRGPRELLAELGGGDIAVATGILLGAAARRTAVLLDGPVGVAAGLVARDLAGQTRHWCLLPDHGRHPTVKQAASVLGLDPVVDLRLDLGEGANALAVLPLLQSMLGLVNTTGQHPATAPPE